MIFCFSRGDNSSYLIFLGVRYGDYLTEKQTERQIPDFIVVKTVIDDGIRFTIEYLNNIGEINPVLREIRASLIFVPFKSHT